jgi:hypothetical protein
MINDNEIVNIKNYIQGTIKSMLGWYNLKNDNEIDIVNIITYYILNKFVKENIKYNKYYYYYFYKNNVFNITIIKNGAKYDLIFDESLDNNNNNICNFNIIVHKDYIIFEKIDYVRSRNIISKFIKN